MKRVVGCLLACWFLSGCSGSGDDFSYDFFPASNFKAENVTLNCPSGDCPQGVGMLVFPVRSWRTAGFIRCTATLVSPTQILTNAHCDHVGKAYALQGVFILPVAGGKEILPVVSSSFKERGKRFGVDHDIAILNLGSVSSHTPRSISRKIPSGMDKLVTYVVNPRYRNADIHNYNIDKLDCTTQRHVLFNASGSVDRGLGLSLFGCRLVGGNSGAGVFQAGNLDEVQAVVHTQWLFHSGPEPVMELRQEFLRFFIEAPEWMSADYGMAERVQCTDIPGFGQSSEKCKPVDFDRSLGEPYRRALHVEVNRWYTSMNQTLRASGIEWTLVPVKADYRESKESTLKPAAILVPKPFCRFAPGVPINIPFPVLRLGLIGDLTARADVLTSRKLRVSLTALVEDTAMFSFQVSEGAEFKSKDFEPVILSSQDQKTYHELTTAGKVGKLPPCGTFSRDQARAAALAAVSSIKESGPDYSDRRKVVGSDASGATFAAGIKSGF